ncbi:uncharacterized protein LOC141849762 [Brevipalpus obovatus]|uniref:uncharacterized protein LOC141849762 n=1 Tax=Brevipalpus obovatus TaxID=246614 RepID=UPI003D9EA295
MMNVWYFILISLQVGQDTSLISDCYCEIPGHVPCPGTCPLPKKMLGKYTIYKTELLESWEKDLDAEYPSQKQLGCGHQWYPLAPKPGLRYQEGIDKPHLREYVKASQKIEGKTSKDKNLNGRNSEQIWDC